MAAGKLLDCHLLFQAQAFWTTSISVLQGPLLELRMLGSCTKLQALDLSSNAFQGPIPWALLATLVHDHGLRRLNLSENNFDVGDGRLPEAQLSGMYRTR